MTNTQSPAPERQRFEATFAKLSPGCDFSRAPNDTYANRYVEHNWQGWNAALQVSAAAVPVEWQARAGNGAWRRIDPPPGETIEQRVSYLRNRRDNGRPMYEVRALYTAHQLSPIEPVNTDAIGQIQHDGGVLWINTNPLRLPVGTKLYLKSSAPPLPAQVQAAAEGEPSEIESVIACLGDDAAQLRGENPEDERAANMERAAELLQELASRTPAPGMAGGVGAEHISQFLPHEERVAWTAFSTAMAQKLYDKYVQGYSGFDSCTEAKLSAMLRDHVDKGDPVDVANFCCFLYANGQHIAPHPSPAPQAVGAETVRAAKALIALVGRPDDPNIGWRGAAITSPDHFRCEMCGVEALDCSKIEHKPSCPIPEAIAAAIKAGRAGS